MMSRACITSSTVVVALAWAASSAAETTVFPIVMHGGQEAPGPGDPDGAASGTLTVDSTTNMISWSFVYSDIDAPTMMHIHSAQDGVSGTVIVNLGVATSGGPGTLIGSTGASATNIANILANPQNFYVNIHNVPFTAGAVRGQIPKLFSVTMNGAQEFPGPGDPDGSATGMVWFDTGVNKVFWNLTYANIDAPTLFHIHDGDFGTSGPVFIDFGVATSGPRGTLIGDTTASDATLDAVIADPAGFYLNLHNLPFPAGAIRGQIVLPDIPADINNDGVVDAADLALLLGQWGGPGSADIDGSGIVDAADLALLLGGWS